MQIIAFIIFLVIWVVLLDSLIPKLIAGKYLKGILIEMSCISGVGAAYLGIRLKWDGMSIKETAIFPPSSVKGTIFKGMLLGSALIGSVYLLALGGGLIRVSYAVLNAKYIALLSAGVFMTAAWEELAFRGLVLPKLGEVIGMHRACLVVAAAFGLMHPLSPVKSFQMILSTTIAGLLLNYAFVVSEGIYFPIGIHFGWNFFNFLLYPKSTEYLVPWLAGRANPEEGLIAIIITAAGLAAVIWRRKAVTWKEEKTEIYEFIAKVMMTSS